MSLASVLLVLGILAGLVNRNVVDGNRFAAHVDAVRRDPAVARQVGQAITVQVLQAAPQLIAVRPLVESASTALAGSVALGPAVRSAARTFHATITDEEPGEIDLRLLDVGAAIVGLLPVVAPTAAPAVPADLSVTLTSVKEHGFVAWLLHLSRFAGQLAWLLPLLALLLLVAAVVIAPDRGRGVSSASWAVTASGAMVGLLGIATALFASTADEQTLHGALVAATWRQLAGQLWWAAGLTVLAGAVMLVAVSARTSTVGLAGIAARGWRCIAKTPSTNRTRAVRGAILVVVGTGAILRPALTVAVLAAVAGIGLVVAGLGEIVAATGARPSPSTAIPRRRLRVSVAVCVGAVALVASTVAVGSLPVGTQVSAAVSNQPAGASDACNGYVALCSRPYNDVAFPATHNAMSAADEPGWFIPEQPTGIIGQLNAGIRVLLIDSYYGQLTTRTGLIATAPESYEAALADTEANLGPTAVASALRLRDAITSRPVGPVIPFLCHGLCEIGATQWQPMMKQVKSWLDAHPRQVVTFFIQDTVSPADTAAVFSQAGLIPAVYTPTPGQPWPTLGQMIASGHRVVVLMENHGGGSTYPWLLQGFHWVQDTPYTNPTVDSLSCAPNRGSPSSPLFLINYWVAGFTSLITNARRINPYDVMWPHVARCQQERQQFPNFIAVNFFNYGDLFRVVNQLNGLA